MKQSTGFLSVINLFFTRYTRQFGLLFFFLVIEGAIAAMTIFAIVPMADYLLDPALVKPSRVTQIVIIVFAEIGLSPSFWLFGLFFFGLNLLKGTLTVGIRYSILKITYAVLGGLISDSLHSFFKSRWEFFSGSDQGRILNTMNKEIATIGSTLNQLATLLAQIVQLAIYLAVPIWLNAPLTLTTVGISLLFGLPFIFLNNISYGLGKRNTETGNVYVGVLTEVFASARLILGFGLQSTTKDHYMCSYNGHVHATLRSQTFSAAIPSLFQPMGMLAVVVAIGLFINKQSGISELAAIMYSLLAAMPIMVNMLQSRLTISNFLPSYGQLQALKEKAAIVEEIEGANIFSQLEHGVELKDLYFTYPGRKETLSGLNIHITKGQMTALVGESGSGKSTITDLVLGLQIPDKGQVLINKVPLGEWRQNSFRQRVGYVPQDPMLFNMSIRDNLLWSYELANEDDLWESLHLANAMSFVKKLPQGINTMVGDRGVRLSGGERQRIALARALLRKPELLILDEATSSMDSASERLIQQSIEQVAKNTTILIVAHRLSTIAKADMVYVMKQGRVVEEGSFNYLHANSGSILNAMIAAQHPSKAN